MAISLSEIKRRNKESGGHFFDKGNSRVIKSFGNYLITPQSDGYSIYKFNESNGRIDFVDNPNGEYSWQPYKNKSEAISYAKQLSMGN